MNLIILNLKTQSNFNKPINNLKNKTYQWITKIYNINNS